MRGETGKSPDLGSRNICIDDEFYRIYTLKVGIGYWG